jgi:hypothetical protein
MPHGFKKYYIFVTKYTSIKFPSLHFNFHVVQIVCSNRVRFILTNDDIIVIRKAKRSRKS